jgi:catechol 2,3-dioxygenase-like lactoylglutathione lyase family enzyme
MKLNHVALVSSCQENADRFYHGILKLDRIKTIPLNNDLVLKIFGVDMGCRMCLYADENVAIEIFLPDQAPAQKTPFSHICLEMENREGFLAECRSAGLKVHLIPREASPLSFVEDFDGNLFEIK